VECNDDLARGMAQDISCVFSLSWCVRFQDLGGISTDTALGINTVCATGIDSIDHESKRLLGRHLGSYGAVDHCLLARVVVPVFFARGPTV
jgi:hypothetical protein